jgi:beta-glucosidase
MIVMAGRPLTIGDEVEAVSSVLYTFHGGTMAGPAISDLVFGKEVPSGKTPVTFPKMVGQIPIYYNVNQTGRPAYMPILIDSIPVHAHQTSLGFSSYWMEVGTEPLFPFGYGLTYTTFSYGTPKYSSKEMTADGSITVSVEVTNTGDYDAYEVVQMYIRDAVASSIRPMKELKGFEKVFIKKGETKTVEFTITADQLSFWKESEKMLEPGKFYVGIGSCSTKLDIDEIELK